MAVGFFTRTERRAGAPAAAKAAPAPKRGPGRPPKPRYEPETVDLAGLEFLPRFQMRAEGLDADHVEDLRKQAARGRKLERMKVYRLASGRLVVVDGFHRGEAYRLAGVKRVQVLVKPGTEFEAMLAATAANVEHLALKRSNKDKRRAVEGLLAELRDAGQDWANRRIADHCGVGDDLVADVRKALSAAGQLSESDSSKRLGADGKLRSVPSRPASPQPRESSGSTPAAPSKPVAPQPLESAGPGPAPQPPPSKWRDLPPAVRGLKLRDHVDADGRVWEALARAGVTTAGEFVDALRADAIAGLGRGDVDALLGELADLGPEPPKPDPACRALNNGRVADRAVRQLVLARAQEAAAAVVEGFMGNVSRGKLPDKAERVARAYHAAALRRYSDDVLARVEARRKFAAGYLRSAAEVQSSCVLAGLVAEAEVVRILLACETAALLKPELGAFGKPTPADGMFLDALTIDLAGLVRSAEREVAAAAEPPAADVKLALVPGFPVPLAGRLHGHGIQTLAELTARVPGPGPAVVPADQFARDLRHLLATVGGETRTLDAARDAVIAALYPPANGKAARNGKAVKP